MKHRSFTGSCVLVLLVAFPSFADDAPEKRSPRDSVQSLRAALGPVGTHALTRRTPKEGLQDLQSLIGSWRGTGLPEGTREEKQKGLWEETIRWEWQFKGTDVWLKATVEKGKYFTTAEIRYLPNLDTYRLTATTAAKEKVVYEGQLRDKRLALERTDAKSKEEQRLMVNLLHDNRYVYHYEVKPPEKPAYKKLYQVGATKEGVPFATTDFQNECVVSGGKGTMAVMYMGKTYYVCCSGCRDAFNDDPAGYIKDFEERKKKN